MGWTDDPAKDVEILRVGNAHELDFLVVPAHGVLLHVSYTCDVPLPFGDARIDRRSSLDRQERARVRAVRNGHPSALAEDLRLVEREAGVVLLAISLTRLRLSGHADSRL